MGGEAERGLGPGVSGYLSEPACPGYTSHLNRIIVIYHVPLA